MAHISVLLKETIQIIDPHSGDWALDCTFGGGGHTKAILDSCDCCVCAIDRDPEAEARAKDLKSRYGNRLEFHSSKFSQINEILRDHERFNIALFDLGISSFQIDKDERGFSFQKDAPLDMRMSKEGLSAYDVINSFSEEEITEIIWEYGNEPLSRRIASEIVKERNERPIKTTIQLANLIRKIARQSEKKTRQTKIDVATKTFQAIRIFVNDELREISEALNGLTFLLKDGARIAVISFHSLEDKVVKNWAKSRKNIITPINKNVIRPTEEEISKNPRSRSAILRGFLYNKDGEKCMEKVEDE